MSKDFHADEQYTKIIAWMNANDFFWLSSLRKYMGMPDADPKRTINSKISRCIKMFKECGVIQCTEVRKGERQYYRSRFIKAEYLLKQPT